MAQRPSPRSRAAQWFLLLAAGGLTWFVASMAGANLERHHVSVGFGFLADRANFDIPFHLIGWDVGDSNLRALLVCTLNTVLVSGMSIVAASLLGLLVGVMRLSTNWLVRNIALCFIELVRNTPLLVQIIFWYLAVLQTLPPPRQSIALPGGALLNIRGLYLPSLAAWSGVGLVATVVLLAAAPWIWRLHLRGRPVGASSLLPAMLAAMLSIAGFDHVDWPALTGFNIVGGVQVPPELVAVWGGLSIYGSAFIAEIVRGAIISVPKGQTEVALSLGLRRGQVLSKVVLPQALRMMVPPLTSQYLNIVKSSSLGAAVAYPELFQIFAGTVLNQSGRELETILILMAIFLAISLLTSAFMNWFNQHVALVER